MTDKQIELVKFIELSLHFNPNEWKFGYTCKGFPEIKHIKTGAHIVKFINRSKNVISIFGPFPHWIDVTDYDMENTLLNIMNGFEDKWKDEYNMNAEKKMQELIDAFKCATNENI